jgi:hypothetical protein
VLGVVEDIRKIEGERDKNLSKLHNEELQNFYFSSDETIFKIIHYC